MTKPTLETDRLILRPLCLSDTEFCVQMNANPDVMKYLGGTDSEDYTRNRMPGWVAYGEGDPTLGVWLFQSKTDQKPLGIVFLHELPENDPVKENKDAIQTGFIEIGYRSIPEAWGHGYNTEAAKRLLQYVFEETPLQKIVGCADEDNLASQNILKKIGLKNKGLFYCYGQDCPFFEVNWIDWAQRNAQQIETERLTLKPITEEDKEFILFMNEDEQIMATMPPVSQTADELRERDDWLLISEGKITIGGWIMIEKESGEPIGSIVFDQMPLTDPDQPPVTYTKHIEVGYRCLPKSWGKGYTTEAAKAVFKFAFENNLADELTACTDHDNFASQAVMKKIGLKQVEDVESYGETNVFFKATKEDWLASQADIS